MCIPLTVHSATAATPRWARLAVAFAISILTLTQASYGQTYTLTDLGTLGGNQADAAAINSTGQVTGWAYIAGDTAQHAYVYTPGASTPMVDIGTLPCSPGCGNSAGFAINDNGQVTGWSLTSPNSVSSGYGFLSTTHAFLYTPGATQLTDLGVFPACNWSSTGTGINSSGQVTGVSMSASGPGCSGNGSCDAYSYNAFLYTPGANPTTSDLGSLGGPGCQTQTDFPVWAIFSNFLGDLPEWLTGTKWGGGINSQGQVTGWSYLPGETVTHAFVYSAGGSPPMSDIGTLGGYAFAFAINDQGQVAGYSLNASGRFQAFLYTPGTLPAMRPIPLPLDGYSSQGYGINNAGAVAGQNTDDHGWQYASLYMPGNPGAVYDLNSLIDRKTPIPANTVLYQANAINANGWIVVTGQANNNGSTRAYLLRPEESSPTCQKLDGYTLCNLHESLCPGHSFCVNKCLAPCENTLVNWVPPVLDDGHGGDPWLNGVSLRTQAATWEQARNVASNIEVVVSTQPKAQTMAERTTTAELIGNGSFKSSRVAVMASLVDVRTVTTGSRIAKDLLRSETPRTFELSLPYEANATPPGANLRMVRFDQQKGHWVDIEEQYVTLSKHLVTAIVPGPGKYTVVAETVEKHSRWTGMHLAPKE